MFRLVKKIIDTRCHIKNKVCSMIIDNDSCTNVSSTTLVRKLNLTATKHASSYMLQWFNEYGKVRGLNMF
jgi:hypothetical protein